MCCHVMHVHILDPSSEKVISCKHYSLKVSRNFFLKKKFGLGKDELKQLLMEIFPIQQTDAGANKFWS